jgi:hypothetical protein
LPEKDALDPPDDEYNEIEASKLHGGWWIWTRRLGPQERAKLMAHELHKQMRECYYYDKQRAAGERPEKPKAEAPWDVMRRRVMGLK